MTSRTSPPESTAQSDSAAQRRIDPAAESVDPTKSPGDPSQLTPDDATLAQEQPLEDAIEKTFPPGGKH